MAKIVYALSGQGRGHASRVIAISDELRQSGHEILFCCGGTARDVLESKGEHVLPVPALRQVMKGNRVKVAQTLRCNLEQVFHLPQTVERLAEAFCSFRPDLLITDFEAFSPRAARRLGIPILSFNHQQIVTETRYRLPLRHRPNATMTALAIELIAPRDPVHVLITSFYFPPVKHPARTTLIPPIIRPAVQALTPAEGDHVLVYYNHADGAEQVLEALRQVDASFIVYNFDRPARAEAYPNVQFKEPSLEGFLNDLATSRAVICTAGFTLASEALFLGKPLLVAPNQGIFEQTLNALFLEWNNLGAAVIDRPLTAADVASFLEQAEAYKAQLRGRDACGNEQALACIEKVLQEVGPKHFPRPGLPLSPASDASSLPTPVEKAD